MSAVTRMTKKTISFKENMMGGTINTTRAMSQPKAQAELHFKISKSEITSFFRKATLNATKGLTSNGFTQIMISAYTVHRENVHKFLWLPLHCPWNIT